MNKLAFMILTEKRLFKKPGYLLVLLLVPILAWGLRIAARQEAGMVTIGLCCEEKGGLSEEIIRSMMEEDSIIRYQFYDSEAQAVRAVESAAVDAAWIFPEELDREFEKMAKKGRITPVVRVIEREDDISLIFTREVLCSRLFPKLAYEAYRDFVKKNLSVEITDEELLDFYRQLELNDNLFESRHLDGEVDTQDNYLLSPVRGLLAIWLVVCGLAAVLFYQKDLAEGVYDAASPKKKLLFAILLEAIVLMNGGIIYLMTLGLMGYAGSLGKEGLHLLLLLSCTAVFSLLCGMILQRMERVGVLIPILVVLMVVACPIFFQIRLPRGLQGILPPYYYLLSLHNGMALWYMVVYAFVGTGLLLGIWFLRGDR